MFSGSRSSSGRRCGEPRFWAAAALVLAVVVYGALRLLPPSAPTRMPLGPVDVPAYVVGIEFKLPGKLDINLATSDELQGLPGIGPALAARIVAYREEHGPFESIDDLVRVSGIGSKTLEGFRELITIGDDEP